MKTLTLIYAVSENHVIGKDNKLPWRLPDDFRFFKEKTLGHPIIMGSRTFQGLGRALPGRQNIVLTTDLDFRHKDVTVAHSLEEAIEKAEDDDIFVIGGATVYKAALPLASNIYETRVHATVDGDTFFDPDLSHWLEEWREEHKADARNQYDYTFISYVREDR